MVEGETKVLGGKGKCDISTADTTPELSASLALRQCAPDLPVVHYSLRHPCVRQTIELASKIFLKLPYFL